MTPFLTLAPATYTAEFRRRNTEHGSAHRTKANYSSNAW